jgi:cytochrome c oxidase cbb3-type subunit III
MRIRKSFPGAAGLFIASLALSSLQAQAEQADGIPAEDLYTFYCVQCHGVKGDGLGVNIKDMSVKPRDHTDKFDMATRTDDDLFKVIKDGGEAIFKSPLMPNWGGNLTDGEISSLVSYLRKLCDCKGPRKIKRKKRKKRRR